MDVFSFSHLGAEFPMKTDQQMCWGKGRKDNKKVLNILFTRLESWGQRCYREKFSLEIHHLQLKVCVIPENLLSLETQFSTNLTPHGKQVYWTRGKLVPCTLRMICLVSSQ